MFDCLPGLSDADDDDDKDLFYKKTENKKNMELLLCFNCLSAPLVRGIWFGRMLLVLPRLLLFEINLCRFNFRAN